MCSDPFSTEIIKLEQINFNPARKLYAKVSASLDMAVKPKFILHLDYNGFYCTHQPERSN